MGQTPRRANIVGITSALPCVITTEAEHEYSTYDFVRLTDLNSCIPVHRGEDQLNNYKFRIIVTGSTTFFLQDPITFKPIDSTTYPPYVTGGYCNLVEQNFIYNDDEE